MGKHHIIISMLSVVMTVLGAGSKASGQDYPNRPVRIVTAAAGGGNDTSARNIAYGISGPLGQNVIVENRPAKVVGEIVFRAQPDGYTLLLAGGSFHIASILEKLPYDVVRDFSPITIVDTSPSILVVYPTLPVRSVKEFIALAKARPAELNYASGGSGSTPHLATELFKAMAGVNIVHVPYNGMGPGFVALLGGQVQVMFSNIGSSMTYVKSGKLRALAVGSSKPSALVPDLPTIAASGVPGYEEASVKFMVARAGTPVAIINRLNQEIVRFINRPEVKGKLLNSGVEAVGSSPEELAAFIKSEMAKWGKVIKDAGIRAN